MQRQSLYNGFALNILVIIHANNKLKILREAKNNANEKYKRAYISFTESCKKDSTPQHSYWP